MNKEQLYPNLYKVTYDREEGDNYASGIVRQVTFLEDITMLKKYRGEIVEVIPIFAQYLPEIGAEGVEQLMGMIDEQSESAKRARAISDAEEQIKNAEAQIEALRNQR